MRDPADSKTADLLQTEKTKAQRFRDKQMAQGRRQFSFWLTPSQNEQVKAFVAYLVKREGAK